MCSDPPLADERYTNELTLFIVREGKLIDEEEGRLQIPGSKERASVNASRN